MKFEIEKRGDKAAVFTPYNKEFVAKMRQMGGKWDGEAWIVPADVIESVREAMQESFRRDDRPCDTVDIELTADGVAKYCDTLFGLPTFQATGRDSGAWIPKGMEDVVSVLSGKVSSGGSLKNWFVGMWDGTRILMRGVPKKAVEERFDCLTNLEIKVVREHNADPRAALLEEKAALEARLAEIERILDGEEGENRNA